MRTSGTSAQRILKDHLKLKSYRIKVQPKISEDQKAKRLKFANWIRTNFRKEDTLIFLFSNEKMFDIDGVFNSQNERIWTPSRADADAKGGIKQIQKFPKKVMVRLGGCSKGVSPLVIFEEGTSGTYKRYSNLKTTCSATTGRFNKMEETRIFTKKLKIGVGLISHVSLTKTIGP